MELEQQTFSILGYNAIINEALLDLFPIDSHTQSSLLNSDNSIDTDLQKIIQLSELVFLELSDVIDSNLGIIEKLLNINPDLNIIGLNEYTQKSYSNRIIELGGKGYLPIHCFPVEFQTAIETVLKGGVFESRFIQKFTA